MRKNIFKAIIIILGCIQLSVVGMLWFCGIEQLFAICVFKYSADIELSAKIYFVLCLFICLFITAIYYTQRPFWDKVHILKKHETIDVSVILPDLTLFMEILIGVGTFKYLR